MGKRTNYAALRRRFRFLFDFADKFIQACKRNSVPIEAIYWLVTPQGRATLDEVACRIHADWQAEQSKQPEADSVQTNVDLWFSAPIVYVQPKLEELERRFLIYENFFSGDKEDGEIVQFDPIEGCEAVSRESHEVTFKCVRLERAEWTNDVLDKMEHMGFRPAFYEELLGFAEKHSNELGEHSVVALGSVVAGRCPRGFAHLWISDDNRQCLAVHWGGWIWSADTRFLVVCK